MKSAERLTTRFKGQCEITPSFEETDIVEQAFEWLLDDQRARRDALIGTDGGDEMFCALFDDEAEFGPDKAEPEYIAEETKAGDFVVWRDGKSIHHLSKGSVAALIKKLGAEEAKERKLPELRAEDFLGKKKGK